MDCWTYHERCALLSARDLMENRSAHIKAQGKLFRTAVERIDQIAPVPPDDMLVEIARRILREYHAALRAGRER